MHMKMGLLISPHATDMSNEWVRCEPNGVRGKKMEIELER